MGKGLSLSVALDGLTQVYGGSSSKEITGLALAGGRGERALPLTLESQDYLRSKALIPIVGRPLLEWIVDDLREQGVGRFHVVAKGRENHAQIRQLIGHGERHGIDVQYSRTRFDHVNTGSAAATLHNIEYCDLSGTALVFPVDSLFDFDLAAMAAAHRESGAVVTVATVQRLPEEIAGKYGVMRVDERSRVTGFMEKPDRARLARWTPSGTTLPTSAGMYLIDCGALRRIARDPRLVEAARSRLDWGHDLLPWLVTNGHHVQCHDVQRMGDLGTPVDYLDTMRAVLAGGYTRVEKGLGEVSPFGAHCWIHESSLRARDPLTGTTLAEKIATGLVVVGPRVRIGRHVEIGPGVRLSGADIGDGADIGEGAVLKNVACHDGTTVGPYAQLTDVYVGAMSDLRSTRSQPVIARNFTALGDEVRVMPGVLLDGVKVYPRITVPSEVRLPIGTELSSAEDALSWIHRREVLQATG
ncbi:sugar phosphate nucleotidyltransferase [Streptosporangium sp. NPDC000396]|uniref:sugar phosphate nucleotidyltransferase n=1 Tax=Streptosporangium sp. NPDC000396 TaxID=3366185 RepID=UPI0036952C2B